jgi:two-component system sensor histidine kinase YesM
MRIRRIQSTLTRAFALIVVLTIVLLGSVSLSFLKRTLVDAAKASTMQFASQLSRIVDNYISYMDDISLVVSDDAGVRAYMEAPRAASGQDRAKIVRFLSSIRKVRRDIDGVFLLPLGNGKPGVDIGAIIASSPGASLNSAYDFSQYPELLGDLPVSSAHVENMIDGRYPWVISLVRELHGDSGTLLGYIQVDLNYAVIDDLCRNAQMGLTSPGVPAPRDSGYVFILGASGDIVYHPRQQLVYGGLKTERIAEILALRRGSITEKADGRDLLYTARPSDKTGWTIVVVSYLSELLSDSRRAFYTFVLLALLCFAISSIVSSIVSLRISRPIESLRRSMQEVERGNFDIDITVESSNEVYQLARDCDIAVKKVRDLIEQNRKDSEQKRILELRALQAQINPHFLYNTLDSIVWMVELGENEEAIDVTSNLARFFRLGISRGSEVITIRTEIEYLETYLSIQKTRYKSKLDYEVSFQPELYDYRILKLLVQPVVENAIYHGIKNKKSPGIVRILGEREGRTMLIRVTDDGVGMGEERLAAVRALLATGDRTAFDGQAENALSGVGVNNVQERIRLYFGSEYGLSFESRQGAGTTVTIRIPLIAKGELGEETDP